MSNATGGSMTNDTNTRAPQAPQGDGVAEALRSAREEIEQARASVSGDDGYNYASGEEYGLRRSGSVEAVAGGVEGTALSAKLANSLAQSKKLEQTYVPVQVEMVRIADDARRAGRQKLRNKGG